MPPAAARWFRRMSCPYERTTRWFRARFHLSFADHAVQAVRLWARPAPTSSRIRRRPPPTGNRRRSDPGQTRLSSIRLCTPSAPSRASSAFVRIISAGGERQRPPALDPRRRSSASPPPPNRSSPSRRQVLLSTTADLTACSIPGLGTTSSSDLGFCESCRLFRFVRI